MKSKVGDQKKQPQNVMLIIKRLLISVGSVCLFFIFAQTFSFAGPLYEPSPLDIISFKSYQEVETSWQGQILSRTIKVKISNNSTEELTNVRLKIDGIPNYVTATPCELQYGNIPPGTTVLSNELLQITIDMAQAESNQIIIVWQIHCESGGERIFDETSVIETIE